MTPFVTKQAFSPVKSLREFVRDALLDRIAQGQLAPGQRVVEATLVKEFAISATPVREAIRELVTMGVLEAQNNKGAYVRPVQLRETIEAFEVRAALESLAARGACCHLQNQTGKLREVVSSIVESAKIRDFAAFQEHNQIFHRTIVIACGNQVLLSVWNALFFQIRTRFTMDYIENVDPVALAMEHLPIVDAFEAGNGNLAGELLATHSTQVVAHLRAEELRPSTATPQPSLTSPIPSQVLS